MFTRRNFLIASAATTALLARPIGATTATRRFDAARRLQALEVGYARLGVCFLDTATGEVSGNRMDEYFAMCSTFKLALVAAYLREADRGRIDLDEILTLFRSRSFALGACDAQESGEGRHEHCGTGAGGPGTERWRCRQPSCQNLGGPSAVTAKFREMGDTVTRLDRYEPDLGLVLSADLRDTTSPLAMAQLVGRITTGDILQPESQERLLTWMQNTKTGPMRLRAGLPAEWRSGNKTGTGRTEGTTNKCNDIAITFPPRRSPIIIAAYFDSGEYTEQTEARHQAVLAEVGRIAVDWAIG
jgi:beta-lactamase class A